LQHRFFFFFFLFRDTWNFVIECQSNEHSVPRVVPKNPSEALCSEQKMSHMISAEMHGTNFLSIYIALSHICWGNISKSRSQ
jgi:hypothetical protein